MGVLGRPLLAVKERRWMSVKWLDLTIKLLHVVAIIGTYAAVLEILLKVVHAMLSFLGY